MRESKWLLVLTGFFLFIATSPPHAFSGPLGYATPLNWAGSGARINTFQPNNPAETFYNYASNTSTAANATTSTSYTFGSMSGSAESSAYVLKGSINGGYESWDQQAGGYFRDELYFETYNGQPAELALTFSVHAFGDVQEIGEWVTDDITGESEWIVTGSGRASLNLGLNVPIAPLADPVEWYYLSNQTLVDATVAGMIDEFTSEVTLKSTDFDHNNLIVSGTYLPFTVSLWGTVNHANLNWAETIQLVSVQVSQGGIALNNTQFTLLSNNSEGFFSGFENEMTPTNPVPEPATMILFGAGVAGLAAARRRKKAC